MCHISWFRILITATVALISGHSLETDYVSILGDPQFKFLPYGPRVMLEGWNFCNRAGPQFYGDPSLPSPRYGDCIGTKEINCTYGPYKNNCVTQQLNNATPSNTSNAHESDNFAVLKEQNIGIKCQVNNTFFWTGMLKNGNYIHSTNLCPVPYEPLDNTIFNNVNNDRNTMNQPRVIHQYTDTNYHGYFEGTWDINASTNLINPNSNISYFKLEWEYDNTTHNPVFHSTIKTSQYYPWLMLYADVSITCKHIYIYKYTYTGVDVAKGEKGGVQYDGRGLMKFAPDTCTDFVLQYRLSVNTTAKSGSSFYFLNMGACWKHNNSGLQDVQCDGNTTTDVTRYVLMDSNPYSGNPCTPQNPMRCPRYHTFINGTVVDRNNTNSYPYDAYKYWCVPWNCDYLLPGEPRCDEYSNPMSQEIMKIAQHSEWAPHGFPANISQGYVNDDQFWTLHVGDLLKRLYFSCTDSNLSTNWTTFNIGPEIMGENILYEWDISEFDVLVPKTA